MKESDINMIKTNAKVEILNKENINGEEILRTIEQVARTCYKSENNITEQSAKNMVKNLIARGHEAMIEFVDITVKFTCDRGVTHEIVRHRVASYAQESTRYCNYSKDKFDNQITYIDIHKGIMLDSKMKNYDIEKIDKIIEEWEQSCIDAEKHYLNMLELGATPQIARSVLNNSTKTEINVKMNLREWRHFFKLRADKPAHPQMREVCLELLKQFKELIPIVFDDLIFD